MESDPDIYLKRASKAKGSKYYTYMLVHVNDILHVASDPMEDMDLVNNIYRLKGGGMAS